MDDMLRGDIGSVLQMPGVGVVAVGTAKQAARNEQYDPEGRAVVSGARLVGMYLAEITRVVPDVTGIGRVRRNADVQIVSAAFRKAADFHHGASLHLKSGRGRCD